MWLLTQWFRYTYDFLSVYVLPFCFAYSDVWYSLLRAGYSYSRLSNFLNWFQNWLIIDWLSIDWIRTQNQEKADQSNWRKAFKLSLIYFFENKKTQSDIFFWKLRKHPIMLLVFKCIWYISLKIKKTSENVVGVL